MKAAFDAVKAGEGSQDDYEIVMAVLEGSAAFDAAPAAAGVASKFTL